jgi:hypothetical protein
MSTYKPFIDPQRPNELDPSPETTIQISSYKPFIDPQRPNQLDPSTESTIQISQHINHLEILNVPSS